MSIQIRSIGIYLFIFAACVISMFGQSKEIDKNNNPIKDKNCKTFIEGAENPQRQMEILGDSYDMPSLKLRIINEKTKEPFAENEVSVRWVWNWYKGLLPLSGPFKSKEASFYLKCSTNKEGYFTTPKFKFAPRGWWRRGGEFNLSNKLPVFKRIEVRVKTNAGEKIIKIKREDLDRRIKDKNTEFIFSIAP